MSSRCDRTPLSYSVTFLWFRKLNFNFFLNLDDKNIRSTFQKSQEWFGKEIPLEGIDDMYKRLTKPCKKDQNPIIRFRLPIVKGKLQCGVYNQQKVFIDLDEVKENMDVVLILHIRGLKVLKQYFYCIIEDYFFLWAA